MSQPNIFANIPNDSPGWIAIRKNIMAKNEVANPPHYNRNDIEAIKAIEASMTQIEFLGYLKGNVEKYLWRYAYKDKPMEDLGKAHWYLCKLMEECGKIDETHLSNYFKTIDDTFVDSGDN
tara:strand:- start:177 stop:539 length:363 start_codon:yes stop_codon:yes gene_type:complete